MGFLHANSSLGEKAREEIYNRVENKKTVSLYQIGLDFLPGFDPNSGDVALEMKEVSYSNEKDFQEVLSKELKSKFPVFNFKTETAISSYITETGTGRTDICCLPLHTNSVASANFIIELKLDKSTSLPSSEKSSAFSAAKGQLFEYLHVLLLMHSTRTHAYGFLMTPTRVLLMRVDRTTNADVKITESEILNDGQKYLVAFISHLVKNPDLLGYKIPADREITEIIGSGGSSWTFRTPKYVLKVPQSQSGRIQVKNEIQIIKHLKDRSVDCVPTIIKIYESDGSIEISPFGTQNRGELWTLDFVLKLIDGLKCIHDAGIIHRDIRPSNIIKNDNGDPIIIDFGVAIREDKLPVPYAGAPEPFYDPDSIDRNGNHIPTRTHDLFCFVMTIRNMLTTSKKIGQLLPEWTRYIEHCRENNYEALKDDMRRLWSEIKEPV